MEGYSRIPKQILYRLNSGKELKIYAVISYLNAANKGKYVSLSYATLEKLTSMSHSSVIRAVKALSSQGLLDVLPTWGKSKRACNRYSAVGVGCKKDYVSLSLKLVEVLRVDKLLVYAYLCSFTNKERRCYISQRCLSEATGISRTTIRKYISELEHDGLICKYSRTYKKTCAKRSFAYRFSDVCEALTDRDELDEYFIENAENGENDEIYIASRRGFAARVGTLLKKLYLHIRVFIRKKAGKRSRTPP